MFSARFIRILTVAVVICLFSQISASAAEAAPEANTQIKSGECSDCGCGKNFYNMGRGLVNVVTCWLEVPRCLVYHNSQVPVIGLVVGACQGAGFTVIRAFAGIADFVSFGFMSDSIYDSCHEFEDWVWDSRWVPKN